VNLCDLYAAHAGDAKPAVVDLSPPGGARTLDYASFDARCGRAAAGLAAAGIGRGERIGILARNGAPFLELVFGALRVGAVPVPINVKLPAETIRFVAADADLRLLFHDAEHAALAPGGVPALELGEAYERFLGAQPAPVADLPGESESVLLYTSGSSGRPKGVLHTHASQLWMVRAMLPPPALARAGQRVLVAAPLYHKNGLLSSKLALGMGGAVVLLPSFSAAGYIRAISEQRCTSIGGVPTMFALVAKERELLRRGDLSSVERVTIGSAPLTGTLLEEVRAIFPKATIVNGYGTTETGAAVFGRHPQGKPTPPLSLGHPLPGLEVRLAGGRDADQGELWIRTPGAMAGYLNLAEETAARLEGGWYKTGDRMRRDADGFYFFVGRTDEMFQCGAESVYPSELEALLERHPAVHQAAVVSVPDPVKGRLPVAFVVLEPGERTSESELKEFALRHGPAYLHPRHVHFVDALPLAGTNKVDRRELEARAAGRAG
jgi:acyl-CoA synthetase (AMP-forming)/AMP-acid ligase II